MILLGFLTTWLGMYGLGAVPAPPQRNLLMRLHPHQVSPTEPPSTPSHGNHDGHHKH